MTHRWIVFAAVFLCSSAALAQPVTETPPPARPVEAPDDGLTPPDLPAVPEALQARVAALRDVAGRTAECWTARGERMEHTADRRCPAWYARLTRGGPAAVHAMGALLATESDTEDLRMRDGGWTTGPRLAQLLAATGSPDAVVYLLRALARVVRTSDHFDATDLAVMEALRTLTGHDVTPSAPWENAWQRYENADARRDAARRWLRWHRDHGAASRAAWLSAGELAAVEGLSSEDVTVRFAAIQRLLPVRAHRGGATAALRALLAREDLPADARMYVARYARRNNVTVPGATTDTRRRASR